MTRRKIISKRRANVKNHKELEKGLVEVIVQMQGQSVLSEENEQLNDDLETIKKEKKEETYNRRGIEMHKKLAFIKKEIPFEREEETIAEGYISIRELFLDRYKELFKSDKKDTKRRCSLLVDKFIRYGIIPKEEVKLIKNQRMIPQNDTLFQRIEEAFSVLYRTSEGQLKWMRGVPISKYAQDKEYLQ